MCRELSGSLGGGAGDRGGAASGGRLLPLPLVVDLVPFDFRRKKNATGSEVWPMLLPLIPENLQRQIQWVVVDAIAKETRSLKLRYATDHLPFAVFPFNH